MIVGLFLAFLFNAGIAGFNAWCIAHTGQTLYFIGLAVSLSCTVWLMVLMAKRV